MIHHHPERHGEPRAGPFDCEVVPDVLLPNPIFRSRDQPVFCGDDEDSEAVPKTSFILASLCQSTLAAMTVGCQRACYLSRRGRVRKRCTTVENRAG
ncbi:hypothetical protein JAAARDRAFT_586171 [Jaapia argillacea MUCL 33604]|uniref:Uncharacterized protein n=1 Tax=Jaapia argillacea MUCL 33604 TaxID=933084 RepID=A0A067P609_9AGAM|nr:hypothetical protein JAAARDRAFT_586171 [Jaapia argillacea MUCL 33604]